MAALFLVICCFSQAVAQTIDKIDDKAIWLYHPDKDQYTGSYEWWYLDAHLDNGWLVRDGIRHSPLRPLWNITNTART